HHVEKIREKLFKIREKRIHPHKDDKILIDWNGLMIAALVKASQAFDKSLYLNAAKKALNFILSNMRKPNNRLLHRYREGEAQIDAYLNDYIFLIWGVIELYEATFDTSFLKTALELNKVVIDHFWDDYIGGYFFTADDSEILLTRQKEIYDGAMPSGNSVAMLNLLRLSYLTGNHEFEEKANIISKVFAERVNNSPIAHTQLMVAVDFSVGPTYTIVIVGDAEEINTQEMLAYIHNQFLPNITLIQRNIKQDPPEIDVFINYIHNYNKIDDKTTAYICTNKTCKPPITDVNKLLKLINPRWNQKL
ncbi:MAG: thioredoxin domain-containing protein, partial [Candidatus Lokiarchaeota archaeon]|nr:thioredoxin domain-containing protein [Candidatus Lokiarchaeota archaeon]